MENILKIAGITSIIAGSILAVGACLYWKAYNEMKKSPIIGWVAALLTMGCITTGITSLVYLFFQPIYFYLAIGAKIILAYTGLMFIKTSLTPTNGEIKKLENDIKKHIKCKKKE